ncbi:MAG TPA: kelch repeat-containing protein [Thermoanaerobaculia bacterium]|nr:kelch repeat-containing protein [Thermoanaerobaculia bacterium]
MRFAIFFFAASVSASQLVGPLVTARRGASATLLQDGRVLVAGGAGAGNGSLNRAEIYDPKTQTFRATSMPMNTTHGIPAAVLLNDGRVLISGGDSISAIVEIYDPATDRFTVPTQPLTDHVNAPLVKLHDGRVLLAAGTDHQQSVNSAVEIYDPASNTWTFGGNLAQARQSQGEVVLPDGRVLFIGGFVNGSPTFPDTEIFDVMMKTSAIVANARYAAPAAVQLADGRAAVVNINSFYTFDLGSQTFRQVGKTLPVSQPSVTLLTSGALLITSGHLTSGAASPLVLTLDPNTGIATQTDTLSVGRDLSTAVLLNDGSVLVIGGTGPLASAELVRMPRRRPASH